MHKDFANIHRLNPVVLNRDEVLSYIKLDSHQHFIMAPCGSDLACDSSRSKSAKIFIRERRMLATAKQPTISTTSWLTPQDLNKIRIFDSVNSIEHPNDWLVSKRGICS